MNRKNTSRKFAFCSSSPSFFLMHDYLEGIDRLWLFLSNDRLRRERLSLGSLAINGLELMRKRRIQYIAMR